MSVATRIRADTVRVLKNPRNDGEYIAGLARGLSVLRVFSKERPELTLSEIAAATHLNVAVVRRCINTLIHLGYVRQVDRRFRLGPEVMTFASAFLESTNFQEVAEPPMKAITEITGASTSFGILSGGAVLYLLHVPGPEPADPPVRAGSRRPALKTGLGHVLLAYEAESVPNDTLREMSTESGISSQVLHETLHRVRKKGYAITEDELDTGLVSLAVAVFDDHGSALGALACTGPVPTDESTDGIRNRLTTLREAARRIEDGVRHLATESWTLR